MAFKSILLLVSLFWAYPVFAQNAWSVCNAPNFSSRVDDVFMVNTRTGYAVSGDGQIVKTTNGGVVWNMVAMFPGTYLRSVEFVNEQKGFAGGFPNASGNNNILVSTVDGGYTWTDLTTRIDPIARNGICGLAVADANTIYGCGNWYRDTGYIVKSTDGGNTWQYIDMHQYAASLIDMHFINKDVGFAVGTGPLPQRAAVILYTTDGGVTWSNKFQGVLINQYCWKIQRLNNQVYFASIENFQNGNPRILKSVDGGMSWLPQTVSTRHPTAHIQGVGFINENTGWTGGWVDSSFETNDGGLTWRTMGACPTMNRVFRVNDTLVFASGDKIWKYSKSPQVIDPGGLSAEVFASFKHFPNPANNKLTIKLKLTNNTQVLFALYDTQGHKVYEIENGYRFSGEYDYDIPSWKFPAGIYTILLKTHEDKQVERVVLSH
jgi:photosystem II stability/assembly factor-like uncharacterized protein